MTRRDRLKQLAVAALVVAGASLPSAFLLMRSDRASELFSGADISAGSYEEAVAGGPVDDGCPRRDQEARKDLTLHLYREIPLSKFDGWIEVDRRDHQRQAVLYRGAYASTITLRGVCYDAERADGDRVELTLRLITKHHDYHFDVHPEIHLRSSAEADVLLWVPFPGHSAASLTPRR
jgi:hypothetical protein